MKHLVKPLLIILFILCSRAAKAQPLVFTQEDFLDIVRKNHPVAMQAQIVTEHANAALQIARGGFDPLLQADNNNKVFSGVEYYKYNHATLKVPAIAGIELKTGFEKSDGVFKNPELSNGLASFVGIDVPLLKGLLLDKRRAALQQAKIMVNSSQQEKNALLNDLLFDAGKAYWDWAAAFKAYSIYENYLDFARQRMRLVKITYEQGDRALADTIESFTQLQNFELMKSEALMKLNNSAILLSQYLWTKDAVAMPLFANALPDTQLLSRILYVQPLPTLVNNALATNPEIKMYSLKLKSLDIDRRLYFQNILPAFNIQANLLSKEYYQFNNISTGYLQNNYKLGFSLKLPLLFRQERGAYRQARLKINTANLDLLQKSREIENKVMLYHNEASQISEQIKTVEAVFKNYSFLLKTEELKFKQGETSLFLINARENKLLETQQKIVELKLKHAKAILAVEWASGLLR